MTGTEDESATTEQHLLAIANAVCEKKLVHDDCRIELDRAAGAIRIAVKNKNFTVPSYCWVLPDFSSPSKMIKFVKKYDGRVTGPNNSDEYCEE